ncbi:MAG: hypothetical protein ABH849_04450 [Nanoarchaeota archaeon]
MKPKNLNLILYGISILITLILHYFIFARIVMHPTLHVLIGLIVLFLILFIFTVIFSDYKGSKK